MADPLYINRDPVTLLPELSANELRQAMALALQYGGRNLGARQGVRPGGNQLQVTLNGSVITVQPGVCCIDPGLTTPQGPYWMAVPVAETPGPLAAADASNPRKDIVIARVYDHDEDASGLRLARTEYIAGVAGPAPGRPNTPAGAFRLATIDVPRVGNGAPVVTNEYPFTVSSGGLLPVRNQAEEDALVHYPGMSIWRIDLEQEKIRGANGWRVVLTDPGAWTDWTGSFNITAATTNPTLGNSSKNARYMQVGKSVDYGFSISIGSTFNPGNGIYFFPFPVPANVASIVTRAGSAVILDNGVQYRTAVLNTYTSTQLAIILPNGNFIDSTGSGTAWAAGDIIKGSISYEAA